MDVDWVKRYSLDAGEEPDEAERLVGDGVERVGEAAGAAVEDVTEGVTEAGSDVAGRVLGPLTEGVPDLVAGIG